MANPEDKNPQDTDEPVQVSFSPQEALELAINLHKQGRLVEAEEIYHRILELHPEQPDALHFLGILSCQMGKREDAVGLIRRAITQVPNFAGAHNNLGNVLNELKRYDEAIAAYRRALELDPKLADAHHNLGLLLRKQGFREEAATAMQQAIDLKPTLEGAHLDLAMTLAGLRSKGRLEEAIGVVRRWLEFDPDNPTALHLLASYTGQATPDRASNQYVQSLFDRFAEKFEDHLTSLDYQAPQLVADVVAARFTAREDLDILDAGCGTGMSAPHLKPFAVRLIGVDLSEGMLAKAKKRELYDELIVAELTEYLELCTTPFDLIVSVDTLNYFGDLLPVLKAANGAVHSDGLLVFTLEAHPDALKDRSFALNESGRYSHSPDYARSTLLDAGWTDVSLTDKELRQEFGQAVHGWLVTAVKAST